MRVINYDQDMVVGDATTNEKLLGNVLQFARRARNVLESDLCQKRSVELQFALTGFIDFHTIDLLVEAGNVTLNQRGFPRPVGAANGNKGVSFRRRVDQVLHQERILLGMK